MWVTSYAVAALARDRFRSDREGRRLVERGQGLVPRARPCELGRRRAGGTADDDDRGRRPLPFTRPPPRAPGSSGGGARSRARRTRGHLGRVRGHVRRALAELHAGGIEVGVFGDIDLEPNRAWVERACAGTGIQPIHPLWARPRRELIDELLAEGVEAVVVAARDGIAPVTLLGRTLDVALADELERLGIDASGELGEYHAVDAPGFARRLDVEHGVRVLRDGVWFLDLDVEMSRVYWPA